MLSQASAQALARLRAYTPPPSAYPNLPLTRRAAVLILLFPDRHGELRVVLTMRAATLRSYASQAALPGGKADSLSETPLFTARREAHEEIGLPQDDAKLRGWRVEPLCELPVNLARTEVGVRPCVAVLLPAPGRSGSKGEESGNGEVVEKDRKGDEDNMMGTAEETLIPRLDPKEVAAVFTAPFEAFLERDWPLPSHSPSHSPCTTTTTTDGSTDEAPAPAPRKKKPHSWYRGSWTDWHTTRWRMHNFYVPPPSPPPPSPSPSSQPPFRVFGMTARILVDCARVAYGREPSFEHNAHFGDEEVVRRLLAAGRLGEVRRAGEVLTGEDVRGVMDDAESKSKI